MTAPRRRIYGPGTPLAPARPEDTVFTGSTYSDDEIDESYGITGPAAVECSCWDSASMEFDPAGPCARCVAEGAA